MYFTYEEINGTHQEFENITHILMKNFMLGRQINQKVEPL